MRLEHEVVARLDMMDQRILQWQDSVKAMCPVIHQEFTSAQSRLSLTRSQVFDFLMHMSSANNSITANESAMQTFREHGSRDDASVRRSPVVVADMPGCPGIYADLIKRGDSASVALAGHVIREVALPFW